MLLPEWRVLVCFVIFFFNYLAGLGCDDFLRGVFKQFRVLNMLINALKLVSASASVT